MCFLSLAFRSGVDAGAPRWGKYARARAAERSEPRGGAAGPARGGPLRRSRGPLLPGLQITFEKRITAQRSLFILKCGIFINERLTKLYVPK